MVSEWCQEAVYYARPGPHIICLLRAWTDIGSAAKILPVMPTSPTVTNGGAGDQIFGRERELARLDELLDRVPERGAALLVRGRRASANLPCLRRPAVAPRLLECGC